MTLVKSLLMASVGLTILGSHVSAADYFVQPLTPGPVANTPIAAISLQATTPDDESAPSAEQSSVTEPVLPPPVAGTEAPATEGAEPVKEEKKEPTKLLVSPGAKFVRARPRQEPSGESSETAPIILPTESAPAATEAPAPVSESSTGGSSGATTETATETVVAETPATETPATEVAATETPATATATETAATETATTAPAKALTAAATEQPLTPVSPTPVVTNPTTPVVTNPAPTPTTVTGPAPVMSASQTYKSLGALLQTGKVTGGDRIFLLGGYHGTISLAGLQFGSNVTITSMPGQVAHVDSITIRSSKKITFSNLKVWPTSAANGLVAQIRSYNDTSDLVFADLDVRAAANSTNYSNWTITDWNNNQRSGFLVDGPRQTVYRNRVTGIYNGIFVLGQNALVEENIIDGFAGDAFRALGDGSVLRRNKAQNCHQTNGTHTDGFQSFSRGPTGKVGTGVVRNITIDSNKFLEFVGTRSPIACKLQGIGLFDGMYDGFVIRNNLISSTAYHGITIGGGLNSVITNNTVIHAMGNTSKWPWLRVSNHKNGTPSQNVTVANNLVSSLKVVTDPTRGILETNNVTVTNASGEFTAVNKQDFTLKSTATAIDKGKPALAPATDIAKSPRPKGKAPDAGAYESF